MQRNYILLGLLIGLSGCSSEKRTGESQVQQTPLYGSKILSYEQRVAGALIGAQLGSIVSQENGGTKPLYNPLKTLKIALHAKQKNWDLQEYRSVWECVAKRQGLQENELGDYPEAGILAATWPMALLFSEQIPLLIRLTDYQVQACSNHPITRGAAAAFAAGFAHALHDVHPFAIARAMTKTAPQFATLEKPYRPDAKKISGKTPPTIEQFKHNLLLTSDVIRYGGGQGAGKGMQHASPKKILGTVNDAQKDLRSPQGFLLGWTADEAVGAALYIFLRHPHDLMTGIIEGAQSPGNNVLIATLAGALIGGYSGLPEGLDLSKVPNKEELFGLAHIIAQCEQVPL